MRIFTLVYVFLLCYIIAALVFWGVSLERQSNRIFDQDIVALRTRVDSMRDPGTYYARVNNIQSMRTMRTKQYIGEGGTFLVVILIGAVVVYSSFMRSLRLSRQQNNFMMAVTHELKSPIAAMKLNLQTLEKHQLDEQKRKVLVERCIKESNRLNDLCNNMLFASQLEGRRYKFAKESFDISELIEDVVSDYASRYPRRFEEEIEAGHKYVGDKVMLQIAMTNLLENAVKYSPADMPIMTKMMQMNNKLCIQVIDLGNGVPDEEKKKIFDKFYRVGNEASRKSTGTGIGLYLTRKVVTQHKGTICVKDNKPSGSIFEIVLPLG